MQRTLYHLSKLVEFYPLSSDQKAVKELLFYCKSVLVSSESFRDVCLHSKDGFHSLTASTQNTKIPKLLLQAHVDVVAAPEPSRHLQIRGDEIIGRGVFDMLFATACYLSFVEKYKKTLPLLDIGLMLSGDEELGGFNGVNHLLNEGYGCEVCLLPDAGHGFGDLNVSAKGVMSFDLVALGKAHHASRPWEGDGAANKLVYMLHDLMHEFDHTHKENSTMTITKLGAGDAVNKGPSKASTHVDIRFKDSYDFDRISNFVDKIAKKYGANIENLQIGEDYKLDFNNDHVKQFMDMYASHAGQEISLTKAHGSSDARFFAAKGIPVIMFRPDGSGAHADIEKLSQVSLSRFYGLFEAFTLKTARIKL